MSEPIVVLGVSGGRVPPGTPVPLSPSQARIWFLTQLFPTSAEYNVFDWLRFQHAPDQESLRDACRTLAERHDALRLRPHPYEFKLYFDI